MDENALGVLGHSFSNKGLLQQTRPTQEPYQWTQCFLWYKSQEEAEMVAQALDGSKLPGWWRRLSAELARTNPSWQPLDLSEIIYFLILCGALFYVGRFKKI